MNLSLVRDCELAFAAEAAAHAAATLALNPLSEAESRSFGPAEAVFTGTFSPVHGVYALGADGEEVTERDFAEIDAFFARKERAAGYWVSPLSPPDLLARIASTHRALPAQAVHIWEKGAPVKLAAPAGSSSPDLDAWCLAFSRVINPDAREPNLLAFTKLHQRQTRFYLGEATASYTFFHSGIAVVAYPGSPELLALQLQDAAGFGARATAVIGVKSLPRLYERTYHEPTQTF